MKNQAKLLAVCFTVMLFVLTSCHKQGCPGQITDTYSPVEMQDLQEATLNQDC